MDASASSLPMAAFCRIITQFVCLDGHEATVLLIRTEILFRGM
jgi:hypothetical protein